CIYSQREKLKPCPEKLGMQQCLKRSAHVGLCFLRDFISGQTREQSRDEVILIGKPVQCESAFLCSLRDTRPIDMRRDIGVSDLSERRRDCAMLRPALQRTARSLRRVKFITRITVVDCQDVAV